MIVGTNCMLWIIIWILLVVFVEKTQGVRQIKNNNLFRTLLQQDQRNDGIVPPRPGDGIAPPRPGDGTAPPRPEDGNAPPRPGDGTAPPRPQDGMAPPRSRDGKNCIDPHEIILWEYPSVTIIQKPAITDDGKNVCAGVLWGSARILASAECLYKSNRTTGISVLEQLDFNPLSQTFGNQMQVEIGAYCRNGFGFGKYNIVGANLMPNFSGDVKEGNGLVVFQLDRNATGVPQNNFTQVRDTEIQEGEILRLVGHISAEGEQSKNNVSLAIPFPAGYCSDKRCDPVQVIESSFITDVECELLLAQINPEAEFKQKFNGDDESCMVVLDPTTESTQSCGDFGNPVYGEDGKIVGVMTKAARTCGNTDGSTTVIIFADLTKSKNRNFLDTVEKPYEQFGPNIRNQLTMMNDCREDEKISGAPFVVSIQFKRPTNFLSNGGSEYVHHCGGTLINNAKHVLTAASCVWDKFFSSQVIPDRELDFRDLNSVQQFQGTLQFEFFAAIAPQCRHFNGSVDRVRLTKYVLNPQYNGNPYLGYNVAILTLEEQLPASQSLQVYRGENVFDISGKNDVLEIDFEAVEFYGWGARLAEEAQNYAVFWNMYSAVKQIPMNFVPLTECAESLWQEDNVRSAMLRHDSFCLKHDNSIARICEYDQGGPLVGKLKNNNQLFLIGMMSWLQDPTCENSKNLYELFLDVQKFSSFVLSIEDFGQNIVDSTTNILGKSNSNQFPIYVIVILIIVVFFILSCAVIFLAYRRNRKNKAKESEQFIMSKKHRQFSDRISNIIKFDPDVQNVYQILSQFAHEQKDKKTGKPRRHSNLPGDLRYFFGEQPIDNPILGYSVPGLRSVDDSMLYPFKNSAPTSPFVLAAITMKSNTMIQIQKPVKRSMHVEDPQFAKFYERMLFLADQITSAIESQNGGGGQLITGSTPARVGFDLQIDYDEDLDVRERIGAGAFGSVYKAYWKTKNMDVAVKIIHTHILEQLMQDVNHEGTVFRSFLSEIGLLARMDNPRIVKCYGGSLKPPNVCLILEFMQNGSLDSFIHQYPGQIPIPVVMKVSLGIAEGLSALHPTVVHRDLKPQNILLDENYNIKLADFGVSRIKEETYLSETTLKGTPSYIAPEVFLEESVDEKCDIYALGLIMWEMITKTRPWQGISMPMAIMAKVAVQQERPNIPDFCPPELSKLVQKCWAPNPKDRPTAHEIVHKLALMREKQGRKLQSPFLMLRKQEKFKNQSEDSLLQTQDGANHSLVSSTDMYGSAIDNDKSNQLQYEFSQNYSGFSIEDSIT